MYMKGRTSKSLFRRIKLEEGVLFDGVSTVFDNETEGRKFFIFPQISNQHKVDTDDLYGIEDSLRIIEQHFLKASLEKKVTVNFVSIESMTYGAVTEKKDKSNRRIIVELSRPLADNVIKMSQVSYDPDNELEEIIEDNFCQFNTIIEVIGNKELKYDSIGLIMPNSKVINESSTLSEVTFDNYKLNPRIDIVVRDLGYLDSYDLKLVQELYKIKQLIEVDNFKEIKIKQEDLSGVSINDVARLIKFLFIDESGYLYKSITDNFIVRMPKIDGEVFMIEIQRFSPEY